METVLQSMRSSSHAGRFNYGNHQSDRHDIAFKSNPSLQEIEDEIDLLQERLSSHPAGANARLASLPITNLANWAAMRLAHAAAGLESVGLAPIGEGNFEQFAALRVSRNYPETFAASLLGARFRPEQRLIGITVDGAPVGLIRYEPYCVFTLPRNQVMLHSLLIDTKHQHRGIGSAALFLFLLYTFTFHRVPFWAEARVACDNLRAIAAFRNAGFQDGEMIDRSEFICMRASRDFRARKPIVVAEKPKRGLFSNLRQ